MCENLSVGDEHLHPGGDDRHSDPIVIRIAKPGDRNELISLWRACFDDSAEEVTEFFDYFGERLISVVAEVDGAAAGVAQLFPAGNLFVPPSKRVPCAMVYAVGTLPEFRRRGVGGAMTRELTALGKKAGYEAIVLHPAEDGLFDFYAEKAGFFPAFYADERQGGDSFDPAALSPVKILPGEYRALRERFLRNSMHIDFDENAIGYQQLLCEATGGFLAALVSASDGIGMSGDAIGCAVIELIDETVNYKELLMSGETPRDNARRFGMLNFNIELPGYMGLAFD